MPLKIVNDFSASSSLHPDSNFSDNLGKEPSLWKKRLRTNFTSWEKLSDFLELSREQRESILKKSQFPLNFPYRLAEKVEKGTLDDPILKQFLPIIAEKIDHLGFVSDPVGDSSCRLSPKLLHKYQGRVLLVCTSACAMHCRYCFRQNFDYETTEKGFAQELQAIANDDSIREVLLSGGDPLSLSDQDLEALIEQLNAIPHIKRLRIHTRFPVGIPERIDEGLLNAFAKFSKQIWVVLHVNHPKELDQEVLRRVKDLQKIGIVVLNQTVLLKGVNDCADTLVSLCERLVDHGIVPYYLHQLDRVKGAWHFEVDPLEGKRLIAAITARLPGYAVPRYVQEIAGEKSKTMIL